MSINFESTMTEADFVRPLLDPSEDRLARELQPEPDLSVDGMAHTLVSRIFKVFGVTSR